MNASPAIFSSVQEAQPYIDSLRTAGKTVVSTNGCFDILHTGHVRYLAEAAALGDLLIVGINSDRSVRRFKGPSRPVQKERDRLLIVGSLRTVDCAFVFEEDDPRAFIEVVRPDIHVKGGDYTPGQIIEKPVVEKYGGTVRLLSYVQGYSTSSLIESVSSRS